MASEDGLPPPVPCTRPIPGPPFVLSEVLEINVLAAIPAATAHGLLAAEAQAHHATIVQMPVDMPTDLTLPSGVPARAGLDSFDLLWVEYAAITPSNAPGFVALLAAAENAHLPAFMTQAPSLPIDFAVSLCAGLSDAIAAVRDTQHPRTPRGNLDRLQRHYARMAAIRGYETARPQDTMLLLTEEIGELAHALRNYVGLRRGHLQRDLEVAQELADIQLYVLHLANITQTRLASAVELKEVLNHERWRVDRPTATGEGAPPYLAVEGLIGSGKTTAAIGVAERLGVTPVLERVADHPFLERFYTDPQRYAVEVELTFILMRWHELRDHIGAATVVADYAPFKDIVFASILLDGYDLDLVRHLWDHFWQRAPRPTLTVFLDVSPDVALARIRKRARPFELGIEASYLTTLRDSYLDQYDKLGEQVVTLQIEADDDHDTVVSRVLDVARRYGLA